MDVGKGAIFAGCWFRGRSSTREERVAHPLGAVEVQRPSDADCKESRKKSRWFAAKRGHQPKERLRRQVAVHQIDSGSVVQIKQHKCCDCKKSQRYEERATKNSVVCSVSGSGYSPEYIEKAHGQQRSAEQRKPAAYPIGLCFHVRKCATALIPVQIT